MSARTRIGAVAALLAFAAALPAVAAAKTPEAYEKVGNTITKQGVRRNVFGGAAGAITMSVPRGKGVCVVKPNGTIKAAKIGTCTLKLMLMPASGDMQSMTVILHVTKTGKTPKNG